MDDNIVELRGINKRFPGVQALEDVNFAVKRGEVHGLVGENGAGKSTLLKILSGFYEKDSGSTVINGKKADHLNVAAALRLGIRMLAQNPEVFPSLSIAENIFMEDLPLRNGFLDAAQLFKSAQKALEKVHANLDTHAAMESLSFLHQKIVLIAKAVWYGSKMLILDEPTASLTAEEVNILFDHVRELNRTGTTIIYVSHYLEEVFEICDRVTVLREGKNVLTDEIANMDLDQLVRHMIGKDVVLFPPVKHKVGKEVLEVCHLKRNGRFKNVSLHVREGEIVCIAGIKGSGKEDIVDVLFGFQPADGGEIYVRGQRLLPITSYNALRNGLLLLPPDRLLRGLFMIHSIVRNISICSFSKVKGKIELISNTKERQLAKQYCELLSIRAGSVDQEVQFLSGGNQQKVMLAKVLAASPRLLVLHEPTAGIDIGSKAEIHEIIENLARENIAIVLVTYDLSEILHMTDRVYIMYKGEVIKELHRGEVAFNKKDLTFWMEGMENESSASSIE